MEKQRWEESEKRREEKKREDQRRERVRRKKMQARGKVEKSRCIVFFQWVLAAEGRKVGSRKRRVRSCLGRWKMNNCMQLWREARIEVKMYKTLHVRTTFGSWDVEKAHTVVAQSTLPSQNVQSTPTSNHFWKLRCRKRGRCCGAKHVSKSKCAKHTRFGPLFEVEISKKWREADFQVKSAKNWRVRLEHFWRFRWGLRGRRKGLCTLPKVRGFVAFPKTMAGVRHLKRIWNDAFRVAGAVQETWSSEMLGGQGWFPARRCILEHQIFSFAKIILRDRCNTSYDLASLFRGRCSTLDRRSGKIAIRIGTRPSALHSTFHFGRKSHRIASFLMLSISKIEDVSQNCCVFDVVNFKNWGCLAGLLRVWRCQVETLWKSRRIASFSILQIDR